MLCDTSNDINFGNETDRFRKNAKILDCVYV